MQTKKQILSGMDYDRLTGAQLHNWMLDKVQPQEQNTQQLYMKTNA